MHHFPRYPQAPRARQLPPPLPYPHLRRQQWYYLLNLVIYHCHLDRPTRPTSLRSRHLLRSRG